jgi:hypothetical protein
MSMCIDHKECSKFPERKCLWPTRSSHADKRTYEDDATVQGIPIMDKHQIEAAGLNILTRNQNDRRIIREKVNSVSLADQRLLDSINKLHTGLKNDVYNNDGV